MNIGEINFQLTLFTQIASEILTVKSTDMFSTLFEQGIFHHTRKCSDQIN